METLLEIAKVYYKHYRYFDNTQNYESVATNELLPFSPGKMNWTPTCKGGATECYIVDRSGMTFYGEAKCSRKDNFVYRKGRDIAFGRALKKMREYYAELPF